MTSPRILMCANCTYKGQPFPEVLPLSVCNSSPPHFHALSLSCVCLPLYWFARSVWCIRRDIQVNIRSTMNSTADYFIPIRQQGSERQWPAKGTPIGDKHAAIENKMQNAPPGASRARARPLSPKRVTEVQWENLPVNQMKNYPYANAPTMPWSWSYIWGASGWEIYPVK